MALTTSGCVTTTYRWVKEGLGPQHAQARFAACQLDAERAHWSSTEDDDDRAARVLHEAQLCMKADGWRRVSEDGEPASEESFQVGPSPRSSASGQAAAHSAQTSASDVERGESDSDRSSADEDSGDSRDRSSKAGGGGSDDADDEDDDE